MHKQNLSRLIVWTLVVSMPLWFGGCGSKNDAVTPASIEGSWRISGYKIDPALFTLKSGQKTNDALAYFKEQLTADDYTCLTTSVTTFNAGGKVTDTPGAKCTSTTTTTTPTTSTWKLDGTKLTITSSSSTDVYDTVLNGNSLKLSQTDSSTDFDGDGKKDTVTITLELTKV